MNSDPLDYNPSFMKIQADLENEIIQEEKKQFDQVVEQDKVTMFQALKTDQTHKLIRDHIKQKQQESYRKLIGRTPLDENETMDTVRAETSAFQYLLDLYDAFEAEGEVALKNIDARVEKNIAAKKPKKRTRNNA